MLVYFIEAHSIRNAIKSFDKGRHTATILNNIGMAKFITGDYETAYAYHAMCYDDLDICKQHDETVLLKVCSLAL